MPKNDPIQSIQRTVKILYAIAGAEDGKTIRQIADAVKLKPNTAYRFIRTLESERLLLRREHPLRFVLGHALTELKYLDDGRHLLSMGSQILAGISTRMPDGDFALFEYEPPFTWQRLCVEGTRPSLIIRRKNFLIQPYMKASSLLFLAYCAPEYSIEYFRVHSFERDGKPWWGTKERLEDFLAKVRYLGYAAPNCEEEGVGYRVAFPVFSQGHELLASVGAYIMGAATKTSQQQLFTLCRQAAQKIQEAL